MNVETIKKEYQIKTCFDYPPIPVRDFDWSAYFDNTYEPPDVDGVGGDIVGVGKTEVDAIEDLLSQWEIS